MCWTRPSGSRRSILLIGIWSTRRRCCRRLAVFPRHFVVVDFGLGLFNLLFSAMRTVDANLGVDRAQFSSQYRLEFQRRPKLHAQPQSQVVLSQQGQGGAINVVFSEYL